MKEFKSLISDWMLDESKSETPESHPWKISESDLQTQKEKVRSHVKLKWNCKKQYPVQVTIFEGCLNWNLQITKFDIDIL